MQIIIDKTITDEEERLLSTTYKYPILRFNGSTNNKFPENQFNGNKYDTIFLSRDRKNFQIYDNQENVYSYPIFVMIDSNIWDGELDEQVDAKVDSIDQFIKGNIKTLFSEKYAFTSNYNFSVNNSSIMKTQLSFFYKKNPNEFLGTYTTVNVYSLGRFLGRHKRVDNIDIFSKKIELKYLNDNEKQQKNFANFISGSYTFFKNMFYNVNYDYVCNVPVKPGKYNRFQNIVKSNIILLKKEYPDLKQLSPSERAQVLDGAFSLLDGIDVQGKDILLVDDVLTTGSTCIEIIKLLYNNGARKVDIFTLAKTVHNDLEENSIRIVCPNCKENVYVFFRKNDGLPFIKCNNENCKYYKTWHEVKNGNVFHILHYLYGMTHNL